MALKPTTTGRSPTHVHCLLIMVHLALIISLTTSFLKCLFLSLQHIFGFVKLSFVLYGRLNHQHGILMVFSVSLFVLSAIPPIKFSSHVFTISAAADATGKQQWQCYVYAHKKKRWRWEIFLYYRRVVVWLWRFHFLYHIGYHVCVCVCVSSHKID